MDFFCDKCQCIHKVGSRNNKDHYEFRSSIKTKKYYCALCQKYHTTKSLMWKLHYGHAGGWFEYTKPEGENYSSAEKQLNFINRRKIESYGESESGETQTEEASTKTSPKP